MRAARVTTLDGPSSVVVETDVAEPTPAPGHVLVDVHEAGVNFPDVLMIEGPLPDAARAALRAGLGVRRRRAGGPRRQCLPTGRPGGGVPRARRLRGDGGRPRGDGLPAARQGVVRGRRRTADELPHGPVRPRPAGAARAGRGRARARRRRRHRHRGDPGRAGHGRPGHRRRVSADKIETARAAGAHHVVMADGFLAAAKELTEGAGVDVVVDPVGGDRFTDSLRSLAPEGRLLVIGFTAGQIPEVKVNRLLLGNLSVVGVGWGAFWQHRPDYLRAQWEALLPLLEQGLLDPPIGSRHPLDDVAGALTEIDERRARGKVTLTDPVGLGWGVCRPARRHAAHLPPQGPRHRRGLRARARPRAGAGRPRRPGAGDRPADGAARRAAVGSGIPAARRAQRRRLGGRAGPRARHVGRARPARQQRRGRGRRAHRRRDDAGVALDRRHQPARRRARMPHLHPAPQGSRAAGTSSTPPRSPGSCTRRGWRPTTRSRPASSRSARPCRTSWRRTASTSRSCAPSFFRTNLGASFQGADTEMEEAGKRMVSRSRRSAEQVAQIVVRGIDARRDVILTDRDGHLAWRAKRFVRPAYTAVMKRAAARRSGCLTGRVQQRSRAEDRPSTTLSGEVPPGSSRLSR